MLVLASEVKLKFKTFPSNQMKIDPPFPDLELPLIPLNMIMLTQSLKN